MVNYYHTIFILYMKKYIGKWKNKLQFVLFILLLLLFSNLTTWFVFQFWIYTISYSNGDEILWPLHQAPKHHKGFVCLKMSIILIKIQLIKVISIGFLMLAFSHHGINQTSFFFKYWVWYDANTINSVEKIIFNKLHNLTSISNHILKMKQRRLIFMILASSLICCFKVKQNVVLIWVWEGANKNQLDGECLAN